jgi:hypothetical protein
MLLHAQEVVLCVFLCLMLTLHASSTDLPYCFLCSICGKDALCTDGWACCEQCKVRGAPARQAAEGMFGSRIVYAILRLALRALNTLLRCHLGSVQHEPSGNGGAPHGMFL